MQKQKLTELKLKSFVTQITRQQHKRIKGGDGHTGMVDCAPIDTSEPPAVCGPRTRTGTQ